ncbi:MAG: hypothetical protein ACT4O0_15310 [Pseudonocardia sp.]
MRAQAATPAGDLVNGSGCERSERPLLVDMIAAAQLNAYWQAGRYPEMAAAAAALHDLTVTREAHDLRGLIAGQWGRALLGQGLPVSACARLREATALLREHDLLGVLPLFLAVLARSAAQCGNQDEAGTRPGRSGPHRRLAYRQGA